MKILGNRILVSKIEEPKKEGFQQVEVQDSFIYKGKVEQLSNMFVTPGGPEVGDIILFTKYSPDNQETIVEGRTMKIIKVEDVLAVL